METLRPGLVALSSRQGGLFTYAQSLTQGYTSDEVRRLVRRGGPWVAVRRGVYATRETWERCSVRDAWWLRDLAAHLAMDLPHVLSHDSAAEALGLPLVGVPRTLSHVTRRGVTGSRSEHGVKHHLGRKVPGDLVVTRGVVVTGWARTSLDLAPRARLRHGCRRHRPCPPLGLADEPVQA